MVCAVRTDLVSDFLPVVVIILPCLGASLVLYLSSSGWMWTFSFFFFSLETVRWRPTYFIRKPVTLAGKTYSISWRSMPVQWKDAIWLFDMFVRNLVTSPKEWSLGKMSHIIDCWSDEHGNIIRIKGCTKVCYSVRACRSRLPSVALPLRGRWLGWRGEGRAGPLPASKFWTLD